MCFLLMICPLMARSLIKSFGSDIQNPGKFYWNIKSVDQEQVIVKRGFDSAEEAAQDLDDSIAKLLGSDAVANLAIQQP